MNQLVYSQPNCFTGYRDLRLQTDGPTNKHPTTLYYRLINIQGSCFLTFATEEDCKKFVEAPEQKYKDIKLEKVLFQKDYFEMKAKELEVGLIYTQIVEKRRFILLNC